MSRIAIQDARFRCNIENNIMIIENIFKNKISLSETKKFSMNLNLLKVSHKLYRNYHDR